jgi:hypothetical protein
MNELKFTRGVWAVDSSHVHTAVNCGDKHVAMVNYQPAMIDGDEHIANAHLIAAAPEMYAALDAIIESGEIPMCESSPLVIAAKSALEKARGES